MLFRGFPALAAILLLVCVNRMCAQVPDSDLFGMPRSGGETAWAGPVASASPVPAYGTDPGSDPGTDYSQQNVLMELDVPGLIFLRGLSGNGDIYGIEAIQGYGWQHDANQMPTSGSVSALRPYAAMFHAGHREKFVFEYEPTIALYDQDNYDGRVLHRGGFNLGVLLSRRWTWYMSAHSIEGPVVLGDLGVLSLGLQSYALPNYSYFTVSSTTGVVWRHSLRHQTSLTVADSYSAVHHGPSDAAYSARIQTANGLGFGHDSNWLVYAQANRNTAEPGCTLVGFGAGISVGLTVNTRFGVEGGPEYRVGSCPTDLGAAFGGFLHHRFSRWTAVTLGAKRSLIEPTMIQSAYVDSFSAELEQRLTRTAHFAVGSSYIHASNTPHDPLAGYHGFLFSAQLHWQLSKNLSLVPTYQYFKRETPAQHIPDRRSWVFVNLLWHPKGTSERVQ